MSSSDDERVMRSLHKERSEPRRHSRQPGMGPTNAMTDPTPQMSSLAASLPVWRNPGFLLRRLHQIHSAMFDEHRGAEQLTPVQFGLLAILADSEGLDQSSLAGALGLDRSNVADVLRRLEARGLVSRTASLDDKRHVMVSITPAARPLVHAAEQQLKRVDAQLLGALPPAERQQFIGLLMRVLEANSQNGRTRLRAPAGRR